MASRATGVASIHPHHVFCWVSQSVRYPRHGARVSDTAAMGQSLLPSRRSASSAISTSSRDCIILWAVDPSGRFLRISDSSRIDVRLPPSDLSKPARAVARVIRAVVALIRISQFTSNIIFDPFGCLEKFFRPLTFVFLKLPPMAEWGVTWGCFGLIGLRVTCFAFAVRCAVSIWDSPTL